MKARLLSATRLSFPLATAIAALIAAPSAHADNTWDGDAGGSFLWSNNANWGSDTAPVYGTLTFSGSTGTTNVNDSITSMNGLLWTGTSAWTLNNSGGTILSLFDNGGAAAKIENQSTGLVTINAPITFAATAGQVWGEINAVNGGITFGSGTLTVNGSQVQYIKMFGGGQTTTFNNTVSATGKAFYTTSATGMTMAVGGAFTSGDIYIMNGSTLRLNSGGSITTSQLRLGGDTGTTLTQNQTLGATFALTNATGGQSFSSGINTVTGNTSNALLIDSQNTSGTNTISSVIALDSGLKVQQASGGSLTFSGGSINIKAQTLTVQGAGTTTINEVLSSSLGAGGSLVKTGTGTLILQGIANTYTGTAAGTLNANGTQINQGTLGIYGDASLGLAPTGAYNNIQFTGSATLQNTANNITLATTRNISIAGGATATFDSNGNTFIIPGVISGATGVVTKIGTGTLTLNGAAVNTFAGGLRVNAGTLALDYTNLATPTNLINSGNALQINNGTLTITGRNVAAATTAQTFAGTTLGAGINTVNIAKGASATSATLTLGALTVNSASLTTFSPTTAWTTTASTTERVFISAGGSVNGSALVLPSGATTAFVNAGMFHRVAGGAAGTLRLAAVNSSGQLLLKNAAANVSTGIGVDPTGLYQYADANSYTLTNTAASIYGLLLNATSSGVTLTTAASGTLSLNSIIQIKATEVVNINAGTGGNLIIGSEKNLVIAMDNTAGLGIGALIANNGSTGGVGGTASALTIIGNTSITPGTVTLSGANTYTGPTTITRGTLGVGNANALSTTSGLTLGGASAATLANSGDISGIIINGPITAANAGVTSTISYGRTTGNAGTMTLTGGITGGAGNVIFTASNSNTSGTLQLIVLGGGVGSAGGYGGSTTITAVNSSTANTIRSGIANALPTTTVLTFIPVTGSGTGRTTTFDLNGNNQTLAGLANTSLTAIDLRSIRVSSTNPATLTINGTTSNSFGGTGVSGQTAAITGAISLVKNGTGTQTLTGAANAFTGTTTVLGGILSLGHSGSLNNSAFDTGASITGDLTNGLRTTVTTLTLGGLTGGNNFSTRFTTTTGGYTGLTALTLNPDLGVTNTYSGDIGNGNGSMSLTKSNEGTQVLSSTNSYTGSTTINRGTLRINSIADYSAPSSIGSPASGDLVIGSANTGVLDYVGSGNSSNRTIMVGSSTATNAGGAFILANGGAALTFTATTFNTAQAAATVARTLTLGGAGIGAVNGTIQDNNTAGGGTVALTKQDAGTWTLSGLSGTASSNYSGTTTINQGTLAITHASTAVLTGGLTFGSTAGSANVGTLDLTNASASFGALTVQTNSAGNNTLTIGSGRTLTINGNVTVGPNVASAVTNLVASGGGNLVVSSATGSFQIGGVTTAGSAAGANAVDLSGLASFVLNYGSTGTLRLGDATTNVTGPADTLKLATANTITVGNVRIGDGSGGTDNHILTLGSGANAINATTVNIGSAASGARSSGTMLFDGADTTGSLILRGFAGGTTRTTLNMVNSTGSTANDMSSTVNLAGHTSDLRIDTLTMATRSVNTGAGTATLTFDQGSLDVTTLNMASRTGTGSGNATATLNLGDSVAAGVPTVTIGSITMAVNTSAGGTSLAEIFITGGDVAIGTGSGTAINMANTAAGLTANSTLSITGGTVTVTGNITRTGGPGTETATLALNGASATLDMSGNNLTNLTGVTYTAGTLKNLGVVSNTNMTLAGSGSRVFDQATGVNGEIQVPISGTGVGLTKQGLGKLTLSGTNSYDGDTTITTGTLQLGAGSTTGSLATTGAIVNNGNLTINRSNAVAQGTDFSGAAITGTGSFTQAGTGTTTLNVANSYTGVTTVSAGKLLMGDAAADNFATSGVTVASGATLGGSGTIAGTLDISGNLAPGAAGMDIQTLAAGTTTWNGGSNLWNFDLSAGAGSSDLLAITGDFIKGTGSTYKFDFMSSAPATWGNAYTLATWTNATTFDASDFSFQGLSGAYSGLDSYFTISGNSLIFTAVPEPTSALAGLLIAAGLLRRRRCA